MGGRIRRGNANPLSRLRYQGGVWRAEAISRPAPGAVPVGIQYDAPQPVARAYHKMPLCGPLWTHRAHCPRMTVCMRHTPFMNVHKRLPRLLAVPASFLSSFHLPHML